MNSPAANQIDPATVARPPAYALSIVKQNVETPKIAVTKPAATISAKPTEPVAEVTPARTWTVQVAAVAALKDAERLAGQLRKDGYEAYVVTAQVDSKTWHRVRIGQLERLKEALELKKALANNRQFKDPYVAAR
jgi:DedD protein